MNAQELIDEALETTANFNLVKSSDILKHMLTKETPGTAEAQAIEQFKEKLYQTLVSEENSREIISTGIGPTLSHKASAARKRFYKLLSPENTSRKYTRRHQTTRFDHSYTRKLAKMIAPTGSENTFRSMKNKTRHLIRSSVNNFRFISRARSKQLFEIPLELCTNQYGFSYRQSGWHYWKDMVLSLAEGENPIEEQAWYRFIKHVSQPSYTKLMTFHDRELAGNLQDIPYGSFPWGTWGEDNTIDPSRFHDQTHVRETQNYMWHETGHSVEQCCIREFQHTMHILHSVLAKGYCFNHCNDIPIVKVLLRENGDIRFVSHDGAHRLGILSALDFRHVIAALDPCLPVVYEADVDNWVYVKSGLLDRKDALKLFELYFTLDGTERARHLNCLKSSPGD